MIKPYLSDKINDHKTNGLVKYHSGNKIWVEETPSQWKIQLTMHTKSNNVEIMIGSETDEIIEDLFESFLQKYQEGLENQ